MISLDKGNTILTLDDLIELITRPATKSERTVTQITITTPLLFSLRALEQADPQDLVALSPAFGQPMVF